MELDEALSGICTVLGKPPNLRAIANPEEVWERGTGQFASFRTASFNP